MENKNNKDIDYKIIELYQSGMSLRKVQDELGVSYKKVYKVCSENKIMRKNISIRNLIDANELIKLHKDGMSIKKLSKKYDLGEKKISAFLKDYYEKEAYLNEKYGIGKWKILNKKEIMDYFLAYKEFKKENPDSTL